jgi:hypothetical protein
MAGYDLDKLRKMDVSQRWQLYRNARSAFQSGDPKASQAKEIMELIETSGLPYYGGGGLTNDDPVYLRMIEIVHSPEGREAALAAVGAGVVRC